MPKATSMEANLSVADRIARIRKIVEAIPEGDQDRKDLLCLFDELAEKEEEIRQLKGALNLARYALKIALKKLDYRLVIIKERPQKK